MKSFFVLPVVILMLVQLFSFLMNYLLQSPPVPVLEKVCWGKKGSCKDNYSSIRPFKINVSKEVLDDLHYRLRNAIIPEPIENAKQHYGFNGHTLKHIVDYWLNNYDWKKREIYLNQFPHYKTQIQGLDIHYIHIKPNISSKVPIYPIIICHGWGGSVREFYDIIPILASEHEIYGFAFEVIVPSLPGFVFSQATTKPGLGSAQISLIFKNLMARIGHEKFYVHGGDWGSAVVKQLATLFPENVLGLHCTLPLSLGRKSWMKFLFGSIFPSFVVSKEYESQMYPVSEKFFNFIQETGYWHIQATKPDTIGTAIANSPVGLAAYLLEKFSTLANSKYRDRDDAGLLERYTYDKLIDNIMLYWITGSITSASRIYYEASTKEQTALRLEDIPIDPTVPCAVAKFPNEVVYQPDFILRDKYTSLIQSTYFEEGGHFAALENGLAEIFSEDIFSAVNKMRNLNNNKK